MKEQQTEQAVCALICQRDGIKAREIAKELGLDHQTVNHVLYSSPLMRELCWQDREYRWHGIVRQARLHTGLQEFAGYYGSVGEFMDLSEEAHELESWFDMCAAEPGRLDCLALVYETPVGVAGLRRRHGQKDTLELYLLLGEVGYNLH